MARTRASARCCTSRRPGTGPRSVRRSWSGRTSSPSVIATRSTPRPCTSRPRARRRTALHLAALRGNLECYEAILLHPDCHSGLPDYDGKTAPEYALERGIEADLPQTAEDIDL
mmetsp:Transcript_110198/g.355373  ORF Transcript_110198/g.355373 Transcript_110198/m.355373 type:complete len:114 (+) Transcript_110198:769-1110(+)